MGTVDLPKSLFSPQKPSGQPQADGASVLQNVPAQEDLQQAVRRMLEEETGNVALHLSGKLSGEAIERLDIKGYISRHYEEMFSRYLASDNNDEDAVLTRHTSGEVAEMLRSLGGAGKFNTGEIEKSAGKTGNMHDLEIHTGNILRQKTGISAFLREDVAGLIVKCVFRDNAAKPGTVTDVKLAINVPDSELIDPVFRQYAVSQYLIKELISRHITENIDREINGFKDRKLEERITELLAENAPAGFNLSNIRGNLKHNADIENFRSYGFNMAANSLASILDNSKMDYQFFENIKNGREFVIREYEDTGDACLPDERYEIRLKYFDRDQLLEERKAYDEQIRDFENKVRHLWDLIEVVYQDSKSVFKVNDFEDLAKKNKSRIRDLVKKKTGEPLYDITGEAAAGKGNIRKQFARMHERIKNMYEFLYPVERCAMEDRLARLEKEYSRLDFVINPQLLQPGLLIDADITSIKRRKTTLDSMANALNEFLHSVYRDFQEAAFAAFQLPQTQGRTEKRRK